MKKAIIRILILAVLAGASWYGYRAFQAMPQRQQQVATAKVRRGDVVVRSFTRGELRAVRSSTLIAPNLFGTVQVTRLAELGSFAHEKDLVVEFDDSEVNSRLEEKQLEIDQVDEQIKKAEADLAIRNNQDQVELLRTKYSVRRAELEVKRNELLSAIDAKKNLLNLEEARRRLKQLESDIQSRLQQSKAEMAVLVERKNKAKLELARERQRLSQVKILSPMSGLVAIRQNRQGGFFFPGMTIPDIREGDQVQPGMPVADVLDLSDLEIVAKVGELDRANLKEGQDVLIQLDAVGDKKFTGKIKNMSGTASANIFSGDPGKKFDVVFSVDMKQLLTGLGAKPEQIRKVLETQEQNRKKPASASMPQMGGGMMMAGGASPAGAGGGAAPGGVRMGGPPSAAPGGGQPGMPSPEVQKKIQEAAQKLLNGRNPQDLSPEDRQKLGAEMQKIVAALTKPQPTAQAGAAPTVKPGGAPGAKPGAAPGAAPGTPQVMVMGKGPGPGGPGAGGPPMMMPVAAGQFSEKDLANAKLPPPVEQSNQLDVLLRPGLLADVEIIVEKLPNVINIPAQSVFEKDGKQIAYVKNGSRWDERVIKPLKRTESTMVISEGLNPGETIAMADPNAKPGDKKKDKGAGASNNPLGGMPAGNKGSK
jgi:HlyD family secretion protein